MTGKTIYQSEHPAFRTYYAEIVWTRSSLKLNLEGSLQSKRSVNSMDTLGVVLKKSRVTVLTQFENVVPFSQSCCARKEDFLDIQLNLEKVPAR